MANKIWQDSWPDRNRQRNYPLAEDASCLDTTGAFELPQDFLLGLRLPVDCGMIPDPGRFFLYKLAAFSTGYQITVGYQPLSGPAVTVAIAQVSAEDFAPNTIVLLRGQGDYEESTGWAMIGRLDSIATQPVGQFTFTVDSGKLEADCITPDIQGVSGWRIRNRGVLSPRFTGDLEFVAGRNCRLSTAVGNKVIVDFIEGEGTVADCECEETPGVPIRRINGFAPNSSGDFVLGAINCLSVATSPGNLAFANDCAEPCCGCPELEAIAQNVSPYPSELATLRGFILRLDSSVQTTNQVILASRLGTRLCNPE